jgi:hypothetical protein
MREIGLARYRTKAGEFGRREPRDVVRIRVRILDALELRRIGIFR